MSINDEARASADGARLNDGPTLVDLVCQIGPVSGGRPELGTRAGEYQLVEEVGRGAFGTVYRAIHPVIGKEVAIKVLNESSLDDPSLERRFVTEARAVNRIKHPNIVDIFGFGELANGQKFYVMELLTGETLSALRKREGVLPPRVALEILEPLADALDAAHAADILHRDLKPANVFLHRAPDGSVNVKLLDFGVAKVLSGQDAAHTKTGGAIGTPAYMAPEQYDASSATAAADVYSLGVIAYELLTGRRPFGRNEARSRSQQDGGATPASACAINPQLPPAVDRLLIRMLARDPAERPQSAREAMTLLRHVLSSPGAEAVESRAIDARTLAVAETVGVKVARARRWGMWVALSAVGAFAAGGIAAQVRPSAAPHQPVQSPQAERPLAPSAKPPLELEPPLALESLPASIGESPVTVAVARAPAGAAIFLDGVQLGPASEPVLVPRGDSPITLQIVGSGGAPQSYRIVPDRDRTITFTASRGPSKKARPARPAAVGELEY